MKSQIVSRLLRALTSVTLLCSLLYAPQLLPADAVSSVDGNRIWLNLHQEGLVGYIDAAGSDGASESDRQIDIARAGGPRLIQGLAMSRTGNLLIASSDSVWAFNPATGKVVRVSTMPKGFNASDLAYEKSTGAVLVWGAFLRDDHTVLRNAAYRVARDTNRPVPVLIEGIGSWQSAAFDDSGQLFLGAGADLWSGVLVPTENEDAREYPWQVHAFRIAAIGTPITGEGADASEIIQSVGVGGSSMLLTMTGSNGTTLIRLPIPAISKTRTGVNRVQSLQDRWALQQKVISSAQLVTAIHALPRLPLSALSADGSRIVYQTAATGIRRWWVQEKAAKPRMIVEESD